MLDLVFCDESIATPDVSGPDIAAWRDDSGDVFARAGRTADGYWLTWRHLGTFTFAPPSPRVSVWPAADASPSWVDDQFACLVQPVILQALGREALHASAVETPRGVIAFCGVSGSGKSTLAYALGREPHCRQVADDGLVLELDGDAVRVIPLPFRARLRDSASRFFGSPTAPSSHPRTNRRAPRLEAVFIISQRADGNPAPVVTAVPRRSAFTALLTHAHCFDEADRAGVARMVRAYLTVAEHVPVFALSYRPDFSGLSALLEVTRGTSMAAAAPQT